MSDENKVFLQYHESDNFGDALALYIAKKLTTRFVHPVPKDFDKPHYVICGSILSGTNENSIIWGAGLSQFNEFVPKNKEVLMVRGKLTAEIIKSYGYACPENYCDPGLLLSRLYKPNIAKQYKLGVMAHWVDYPHALTLFKKDLNLDVNVIDLLRPTEEVVDEMLACEMIVSSSLHGLIVAHSYGIPAQWCEFSDKVFGKGFKFWDYFSSLNIPFHQPLNLRDKNPLQKIISSIPGPIHLNIDLDSVISKCPFK